MYQHYITFAHLLEGGYLSYSSEMIMENSPPIPIKIKISEDCVTMIYARTCT